MPADPSDYFLLDSETGELRTAKPLDREALDDSTGVLTLKVKAREVVNGVPGNDDKTVSTADATVTIKDVNDEPPSFNRREYSIEIPENVPDGTPLPHLDMTVKDPDVVSFALQSAEIYFYFKKCFFYVHESYILLNLDLKNFFSRVPTQCSRCV